MKALVTLILGIMIAVSTGAQVRNQGTTSSRSNERTTTSTHTNTRKANENGNRNNHSTQTNTTQSTTSNVGNVGSVTNQSVKPSGAILQDAQIVKPGSSSRPIHDNNSANNNNHNHNNNGYNGGGHNNGGHNGGYNGGGHNPAGGHSHDVHGYHPNSNPGYRPHSPAGGAVHIHKVNPYAHYGYVFRPATVSLRSYYVTRPASVTTTLIVSIYGLSDIDVQRLSIGLPSRFNVVNEYGMFERRYASHADLQLAVRAIGTDYRGRTEYIVELVDLHDLSMIATWGVDNFFSDPKWNIERCLDSNRYEIQRIMTEWDRYHYY